MCPPSAPKIPKPEKPPRPLLAGALPDEPPEPPIAAVKPPKTANSRSSLRIDLASPLASPTTVQSGLNL